VILAGAIVLVVLGIVEMPWAAVLIVGAATVDIGESLLLLRWSQRRRATVGAEALVGKRGVAVTDLWPQGQVKVNGELWNARSDGGVEAGAAVVVRAVDGLTLDVEPA
jgi:membrane protein implicated in regulation of membrane protease activity